MTGQICNLGSSSTPVEAYSVHAEQKYYGCKTYAMHVVCVSYQAIATGYNTMPTEDYPQRVLL